MNSGKTGRGADYELGTGFNALYSRQELTHDNSGVTAAGFGGVAGIFALFFFGDVPRVRKDILSRIPGIGGYFVREIPPEDNPF